MAENVIAPSMFGNFSSMPLFQKQDGISKEPCHGIFIHFCILTKLLSH